jgi:hypothetical protein
LDWFETVNYLDVQQAPRWPIPVVQHANDSHVDVVKNYTATAPLTLFTSESAPVKYPTVSLWRKQTKTVVPLDCGACSVIVPKEAHAAVKTQIYDYPYIDKTQNTNPVKSLDVVFVSNGETLAQTHLQRLQAVLPSSTQLHIVEGVNGRLQAFKKAANSVKTDWFILVPAKLCISDDFDWFWQPDRLQQPKHYIFHAYNPITGLEYGHMAAVAYNKALLLESHGNQLDLTMEKQHEVVPVTSGTAVYGDDITEWRTAFREVIKLRASLPNIENEYRLSVWQNCNSEVTEYYTSVDGDLEQLQKSFDWDFCNKFYEMLV